MSQNSDVVLPDSAASAEGLQVSLHPLPLLNISEHYTRVRIQNGGSIDDRSTKVMGALIGIQAGRELEVVNSFEVAAVLNQETKQWSIKHDFFEQRQGQYKQVFPTFELLGWYSVGSAPTAIDLDIHRQFLGYNESPIFLQLHPDTIQPPSAPGGSTKVAASKLPLDIYESIIDTSSGKSETKFVRVPTEAGGYEVETYEAERIAVDTASKFANAAASSSTGQDGKPKQDSVENTLITGLTTQRNAISMLHSRIGAILEYLSSVQQGKIAPDHETLRQISSLVSSIAAQAPSERENATLDAPAATTSAGLSAGLGSEFEQEQNDVMLMSLLNSMTKNLDEVNMLVDKFGIVHSKEYGRGGDEEMYGQGRRGGPGHRKGIPGDPGRRHGRRNVDGFF